MGMHLKRARVMRGMVVSGLFISGLTLWSAETGLELDNQRIAALDRFYAVPTDTGAQLPANGFYPNGRRLAFMGYSGNPECDLTNGFTVAGAVYGNQMPYLEKCFEKGWPVIAHVGARVTFNDKDPAKYKVEETSLRSLVTEQVKALAPHKEIIWWAIHPEELRPWRKDEMQYLEIVCDAVRKTDPLNRPIYLYNPNHRNAQSLEPVAALVEVIAKGCYVNSCGKKRDRAWVRWSMEQESEVIRKAGRPGAFPILMPELCQDPEAGEEQEIAAWVRHDIYLGMVSGAKAVKIWSLFKRSAVKNTYALWYDAYAQCARELTGDRALAQVFLFGETRTDLKIQKSGTAAEEVLTVGGDAEPATTSAQERDAQKIAFASWSSAELAYGRSRYLFLVNSANEDAEFTVTGWPPGSMATDVFTGNTQELPATDALTIKLPAYGVKGLQFL